MDPEELLTFQSVADIWWTEKAWTLKSMNEIRIPYILERLKSTGIISEEPAEVDRPLSGISILDVGCGGGFVTEPLAELGAEVTGIDGCPELIEVAKKHLVQEGKTQLNLTYYAETIQDFVKKHFKQYDVVLALEFIDHVNDKDGVSEDIAKCIKPGGSVIFSTISKCFLSWIFCKILPEYVFRFIPKGMHEYKKFITPEQMEKTLNFYNCTTKDVRGMYYNCFRGYWFWLSSTSTWYIMHAIKNTSN